jgi:hypothetical protein
LALPIRAARGEHYVRSCFVPIVFSTTRVRSPSASRFFTSGTGRVMNRHFEGPDRFPAWPLAGPGDYSSWTFTHGLRHGLDDRARFAGWRSLGHLT